MGRSLWNTQPREIQGDEAADRRESSVQKCHAISRVMEMTPDIRNERVSFHACCHVEIGSASDPLHSVALNTNIRYNLSGVVNRRLIGGDKAKLGRFSFDFPFDWGASL